MKERRGEINIHQDLLKTQLRSFEEDINQISAELQERISKIEKLSKRLFNLKFEILLQF